MRLIVVTAMLALAGCRSDADRIGLAIEIMHRQVAPDVGLVAMPEDFRVYIPEDIETHYVCGTAKVYGEPERVVVRVAWRKRNGLATFDGRSDAEGRAEFQDLWDRVCA